MEYEEVLKDMNVDKNLELKKPCNHPIVFVLKEDIDERNLNVHYDCVCLNCKERRYIPASICYDLGVVDPNQPSIAHENSIEEYLYAKKRFDQLKKKIPLNEIAIKIEQELIETKFGEKKKTK